MTDEKIHQGQILLIAVLLVISFFIGSYFSKEDKLPATVDSQETYQRDLSGRASQPVSQNEYQHYIIEFREAALIEKKNNLKKIEDVQAKARMALMKIAPEAKIKRSFKNTFDGISIDIISDIKDMASLPYVKRIYVDGEVNATLYESVPLINANKVWDLGFDGKGVDIGIIDTGVDYKHPDLGGCFGSKCKVIGGYDFVNNDADPMDDHGHGTHVAATAAGRGTLNGVAPAANIYAYKVLSAKGSGRQSDIIAAIESSIDPNGDRDFSDHLDVISLSLGGFGNPDDPMSKSIDNAVKGGVVAVVSAGNRGPSHQSIGSPGTARKAITIGATDKSDVIAEFSSRGPVIWNDGMQINKPDVVAPGVSICAAQHDDVLPEKECFDLNHIAISGTSMAAPHVSGLAALLLQKNPTWSPYEIKETIKNTAINLNYEEDTQGKGRIDALNAINLDIPPDVAELDTNGEVKGIIQIAGTATSADFHDYKLDIGFGISPTNWETLISSSNPIRNGVLYDNFDTSSRSDGTYTLKLTLTDNKDTKKVTIDYIEINNAEIRLPAEDESFQDKGIIFIIGTATGSKFQKYTIQYGLGNNPSQWFSDGVNLANGGKSAVIYGILGSIDISKIVNKVGIGRITILLSVINNDGHISEDKVAVSITPLLKGWPKFNVGVISMLSSPVIADLDGNGDLELIAATGGKVYIWNHDGTVMNGWPTTNINAIGNPAVADVDNDNKLDIFAATRDGKVYAWNYKGTILQGWPYLTYLTISPSEKYPSKILETSSPVIGDIDNDGSLDIVVSAINLKLFLPPEVEPKHQLFILNKNGKVMSGWPKSIPSFENIGVGTGTTTLADIDYDGKLEIIKGYPNYLYVWRFDGTNFPGWPKYIGNRNIENDVVVGDLDNDGNKEIIAITSPDYSNTAIFSSIVHVLKTDGDELDGFPMELPDGVHIYPGSPILGDIDNDGKLEIMAIMQTRNENNMPEWKIYVWNYKGELLWKQPLTDNGIRYFNFGDPVIADIDGDGIKDILVSGGYEGPEHSVPTSGKIFAWHNNGQEVLGYPISSNEVQFSAISVTDLDKDGNTDISFGTNHITKRFERVGDLYVYSLKKPYKPENVEWGKEHFDLRNTGNFDANPPIVSITNPLNGATVVKGSSVNIQASASDKGNSVHGVEFYVNNAFTCVDFSAPYSCTWKVPIKQKVQYKLQAIAYDISGKKSASSIVTVTS